MHVAARRADEVTHRLTSRCDSRRGISILARKKRRRRWVPPEPGVHRERSPAEGAQGTLSAPRRTSDPLNLEWSAHENHRPRSLLIRAGCPTSSSTTHGGFPRPPRTQALMQSSTSAIIKQRDQSNRRVHITRSEERDQVNGGGEVMIHVNTRPTGEPCSTRGYGWNQEERECHETGKIRKLLHGVEAGHLESRLPEKGSVRLDRGSTGRTRRPHRFCCVLMLWFDDQVPISRRAPTSTWTPVIQRIASSFSTVTGANAEDIAEDLREGHSCSSSGSTWRTRPQAAQNYSNVVKTTHSRRQCMHIDLTALGYDTIKIRDTLRPKARHMPKPGDGRPRRRRRTSMGWMQRPIGDRISLLGCLMAGGERLRANASFSAQFVKQPQAKPSRW